MRPTLALGFTLALLVGAVPACHGPRESPRDTAEAEPAAVEPAPAPPPAPTEPRAESAEPAEKPPSETPIPGVRVRTWHVAEWGPEARLVPGSPPNSARVAPALDLDPARGDFGDAPRCWVARVDGELSFPAGGRYALRLSGGGETRAFLDDALFARGPEAEVELDLAEGSHSLRIEHAACGAPAALSLEWRIPGAADFEPVPSSALTAPRDLSSSAGGLRRTEVVPRAEPREEPKAAEPPFELAVAATVAQAPAGGDLEALGWLAPSSLLGATDSGAIWKLGSGGPKSKAEIWIAGLEQPRALAALGERAFVLQRRELSELGDLDGDGRIDSVHALWRTWDDPSCRGLEPVAVAARGKALVVALANDAERSGVLVVVDPSGGEPRRLELRRGAPRALAEIAGALAVVVDRPPGSDGAIELYDDSGELAGEIVLPPADLVGPTAALGRPEPLAGAPYTGQALAACSGGWLRIATERIDGRISGAVFVMREGDAPSGGEAPCSTAADGAVFVEAGGRAGPAAAQALVRRLQARSPATFEWLAARALPRGLELEFSAPLAVGAGWDPAELSLSYADLGGVERRPLTVAGAKVDRERRRVALEVEGFGELARGAGARIDVVLGPSLVSESRVAPASRRAFVTVLALPSEEPPWIAAAHPPEPSDLDRIATEAGWTVLVGAAEWRLAAPSRGWTYSQGGLAASGDAAPLASLEGFEDFELELEWRVPPGGAGSIGYRGTNGFALVDEAGHADGRDPRRLSGAAFDVEAPRALASRPAGEWNRSRIVARGRAVEHWIGGSKVLELDLPPERAPIVLDARGQGIAFRAVRVRPLER